MFNQWVSCWDAFEIPPKYMVLQRANKEKRHRKMPFGHSKDTRQDQKKPGGDKICWCCWMAAGGGQNWPPREPKEPPRLRPCSLSSGVRGCAPQDPLQPCCMQAGMGTVLPQSTPTLLRIHPLGKATASLCCDTVATQRQSMDRL